MEDNCKLAQEEEVQSLQSIYLPEELQASQNDGWRIIAYVKVDIPRGFPIRYKTTSSDELLSFHVNYLPAIQVKCNLPALYPIEVAPKVMLTCPWLAYYQVSKIKRRLMALWKSNAGQPVLYTWFEYLKYEVLAEVNLSNGINLKPNNIPCCKNKNQSSTKRKYRRRPVEMMVDIIKVYDAEQHKEEFNKSCHKCQICFEDKSGKDSMKFEPCGHISCRTCLKDYFSVLVRDGNSCSVKCPSFKCDSEVTQAQARDLLPPELFEKYDNTLLNTMLDTLGDITYCPRTFCQYPVTLTPGERLAMCPHCSYAFCIYCRMGYHGVESCKLNADERKKLVDAYQGGSSQERSDMETRYGKKQIQTLVSNTLSEYWIKDNGKNCPKCKIVIEKSDGCNKMTCFRCGAFFCWLCGAYLDPKLPYLHYNDPKSPCNNKLFLMDEIEGDWEWEQWDGDADSGSEDLEGEDSDTDESDD